MFCNQCEQTSKGVACTITGVCGKKPEIAALQDALLHAVKGLSIYLVEARKHGLVYPEVNRFSIEALFATLTNVNFDPQRFFDSIHTAVEYREKLKADLTAAGHPFESEDPAVIFSPALTLDALVKQGEEKGLIIDREANVDIQSLQQILVYGLKGIAAYAYHAAILDQEDDKVYAFVQEALALVGSHKAELNTWLDMVMKCGEINYRVMELLDTANTSAYGHPVPTEVPLGHKAGKSILVSGHDLKDLLIATEGKGINVYTHGEMLPAHGYPDLKQYQHLYGNFGTAWQNQKKEFANFPGSILMTTNCIQEPQESYNQNIFTAGAVGWPGVNHLAHGDFQAVIDAALSMPGFAEDEDKGSVWVGFAHNAVMTVADKVINAVKSGDLKHIFLVGGCDGSKSKRNYYTEFVEKIPADSVVLTLGCGKYRFYDQKMGDIQGIPRLLDMGQCNDAYSAIQVALALSNAFNCSVNELPLTLVLSWYEQKAISILLTLLHLGVKNIRIGPTLPAFISPNVLDVLVQNFGLKPVNTVDEDLLAILG